MLNLIHLPLRLLGAASTSVQGNCNTDCTTGLPGVGATPGNLHSLLQIAFGIIAAVTVLIIVISALKFVTAQGDPQEVAKARGTILYALVGLVVAVSAEVIVTFVLGNL